jgi:hypothetical protein
MAKLLRRINQAHMGAIFSFVSVVLLLSPSIYSVVFGQIPEQRFLYIGAQEVMRLARWWIVLTPVLILLSGISFRTRTALSSANRSAGEAAKCALILGLSTIAFVSSIFMGSVPLAFIDPEIAHKPFDLVGLLVDYQGILMDFLRDFYAFLLGVLWLAFAFIMAVRALGRSGFWLPVSVTLVGTGALGLIGYELISVLLLLSLSVLTTMWHGLCLLLRREEP